MFIAFEGPDNVGKSTVAARLSTSGAGVYNATKRQHEHYAQIIQPDEVITYDRIDWFSHMVYRLGLPEKDWNDDRPRTVFAMPDTHLVVKIHHPETADFTVPADDESVATATRSRGVETPVAAVNSMYFHFAEFLMGLNQVRDYTLFKTVSIVEVRNDVQGGTFDQRLMQFNSPVYTTSIGWVQGDEQLLAFLRENDAHR